MATFVLVAGSWHGAWCWERVVPLLQAAGHTVMTPELIGTGDDADRLPLASLSSWSDQIAAVVGAQADPVILVGHSRAGIIISEAAERRPDAVRRLVYLTAFLVPSGQTLMEVFLARSEPTLANHLIVGDDGFSTVEAAFVEPIFYNTTERHWSDRAASRLGRESHVAATTPLTLTAERFGSVPRAYIECLRDQAVPLSLQRSMQAALSCDPVLSLDGDHSPFYSDPVGLADHLKNLA